MLIRRPANVVTHPFRGGGLRIQLRCVSTSQAVPLAYDLHLPPSNAEYSSSQKVPAVILMHGLFGSKASLRTLSRKLAQAIPTQVYTPDLRNHGESTKQGALPHSYELMAGDLKQFISDHGLNNVVLAGHSMGAKVALYLTLTKPDISRAVISIENAPISAKLSSTFKQYVEAMKAITDAKLTKRNEAEELLARYEEDKGTRQFLLTNLVPTSPLTFRIPLDILSDALPGLGGFPLECTELECPEFGGPALFIRGSRSGYIQSKYYGVVGKMFPKMEVVELDGGHWIHVDQPEGVLKSMAEFVRLVT